MKIEGEMKSLQLIDLHTLPKEVIKNTIVNYHTNPFSSTALKLLFLQRGTKVSPC